MNKRRVIISIIVVFLICVSAIALALFLFLRSPLEGETSFDFGIVPIERPESSLEHIFRLTNVTDHLLQLQNAVPTCGCTTTDWPREPVPVGGVFLIPVQLTLQKSRYRSSRVRLEFKTGEVVGLKIEGSGRFTQPLTCSPSKLPVVSGNGEGTRFQLRLEWYGDTDPTIPTYQLPENITLKSDAWIRSKARDSYNGTPDIWVLQMHIYLEGALQAGSDIMVELHPYPPLHVPIKEVESLQKPLLLGPINR